MLSSFSKVSTKNDVSAVLKLLYHDDINNIFVKINKLQERIDLMGKVIKSYNEDKENISKGIFQYQMEKKIKEEI